MSDRHQITYRDGSKIARALHWTADRPRYVAWWADGTPLRSDNDETSFFDSVEEAHAALFDGGEGM